MYTIANTLGGTYADLAISPDGTIQVIGPRPPAVQDLGFLSLEGITYQPANNLPVTSISLGPVGPFTDWSGDAGFGASAPRWYRDAAGIVHLQGAAKQTKDYCVPEPFVQCPDPWVIGTLPPAARPSRIVYTIVHTFAGTYADLAIWPDGTIHVIGPRPPAVMDLSFVSLEGITYHL